MPVATNVQMPYSTMMELSNETPRELTVEEIHNIESMRRQHFGRKSQDLMAWKFTAQDIILGRRFLSSVAHVRTDEYGGSRENRIRFHLNIIRRIRELCGNDLIAGEVQCYRKRKRCRNHREGWHLLREKAAGCGRGCA